MLNFPPRAGGTTQYPLALQPVPGSPCSSIEELILKLLWTFRVKTGGN